MRFSIFSQNAKLFPDSKLEEGKSEFALTLLGGQTGGIQIMFTDLDVNAPVSFSANNAENIEILAYREMEVCVNRNTNDLRCGANTTMDWESVARDRVRPAPFRTYDPLMPIDGLSVEKSQEVYYVSFKPLTDAKPGKKIIELVFTFGSNKISVHITLNVCSKQLPASTLNVTNWFGFDNISFSHNLEYGSEEHISMIKKYLALLHDCHNNIFYVRFNDMKVTKVDGKYKFDFSAIKRWVDLLIECGAKSLEWGHIISRPTYEDLPFLITDKTNNARLNCLATDGRKYLTAFLTQFNEFLTENNWRDISIVHVSDEPKEMTAADFRIICGIFRKYLPGIKLIDAIEIYFIQDALDIYVPKNNYYQLNKNDFERLRDDRNELWFYTCNMPGGRFLNRFLDAPLLNTRLLHWGNYRYNLTGYLHWGFNRWRNDQDPFEQTSYNVGLPAGDTHIVYPSVSANGPLRSLRFQQMKCGIEDYEILNALSLIDKTKADKICRSVLYAFDDYIKDVDEFDRIQSEMVIEYDMA